MKFECFDREKKIDHSFDLWFWFLFSFFPFLMAVLTTFRTGSFVLVDFAESLPTVSFFDDLFSDVYLLIFNTSNIVVCKFLSWFALVEFVHILYDIVVFIPRVCHKIVEGVTK